MFEKILQGPVLTSPPKGSELKGFLEVSQQLSGRSRMKGWVSIPPQHLCDAQNAEYAS